MPDDCDFLNFMINGSERCISFFCRDWQIVLVVTVSFHIKIIYCLRPLDIFVYHLMKTVEIFRLNSLDSDADLIQPEKKSLAVTEKPVSISKSMVF